MTLQSGSLGRFWLGPQVAKGTACTTGAMNGIRVNTGDLAPRQMTRNIGHMVGGSFLLGDSIKTAAWGGGSLVFPPSLDDYIGWLFYAFAGSVTSNDMGDGTYEHTYPSDADDTAPDLYLTGARKIPGGTDQWERMEDLRPTRLLFGITPGEYVSCRAELMGRTIADPQGDPSYGWTPKGASSVPIACSGGLEMPDGTSLATATAATLDIRNDIPGLQDVLVVGSYYPYDFPVLSRTITLTYVNLYETNTLYQNFFYSAGAWTPTVYSTTLDVWVESTGFITGAIPYKMHLWAANVQWDVEPIPLAGGQLVAMQVRGTMSAAVSGFDWYLRLKNGTASYTWPT